MLQNILGRWASTQWAIMPEAWQARKVQLDAFLHDKLPQIHGALPSRPTEDLWGNPIEQMRVENGIAVIPIHGALVKGATPLEKLVFGDVSYEDVRSDLLKADKMAQTIVLSIKSPGGMVLGLSEISDVVSDIAKRKLVCSFSDDLCASAAYHVAVSGADIAVSPSSIIGSIGTISEIVSFADLYAEAGIDVRVYTSGKYKGTGHPDKPISDPEHELMQEMVDDYGLEFRAYVGDKRKGNVAPEDMEGQTFTGREAVARNLADLLVPTLEDFLSALVA